MRSTLIVLAWAISTLPVHVHAQAATMTPCQAAAQLEHDILGDLQELDDLRLRYADTHPMVKTKKAHLAELESRWSAQMASARAQGQRCSDSTTAKAPRLVDLNLPGAMDRLKREDPAHYATVQAILDSASSMPQIRAEQYLRATYNAKDVLFGMVVLTSNPPKTDLTFRLDDVVYSKLVTLRVSATPEPAASR